MRRLLRWLALGAAALLVAGLVFAVPTVWGKPWSIEHFYLRVFAELGLRHPMLLSQLRVLEPVGLTFHNDDLDDFSLEAGEEEAELLRGLLALLHEYDRAGLDDPLSYDVMDHFLSELAAGLEFRFHDYPVNQMAGFQSSLPDFMINVHQVGDAEGADDYLARIEGFGPAFDQMLAQLDRREALGIVPPKFVMTRVLVEMRGFVAPPPREHVLYTHFAERLAELELGSDAERRRLDALEQQLERVVYPAYGRMIDWFAAREPGASPDDGVWKLPDGERYYAQRLRFFTTTELGAEEIHQTGLAEVERVQAEMRAILEAEGRDAGDLAAAMRALAGEPRFLYPESAEGREQILADYQAIIDEIDAGMHAFFASRPEAPVRVERVPEFKQATAPGGYYRPAPLDGSRPGTFFANLRDVRETPRYAMRTLAYHEAVPGHHYQIAIAQELEDVPFFRRIVPFTAFIEGWALYAERVAAENGFQDDPYDRLGYLTADLFRAVRLVVDTGIHAKRWTREQAIAYMLANSGMPESEVVSEIERYIVNPGQATAYKIGQLRILALREQARAALGADFDLREFHDVVLHQGALPLTLLEQVVGDWIARRRSGEPVALIRRSRAPRG